MVSMCSFHSYLADFTCLFTTAVTLMLHICITVDYFCKNENFNFVLLILLWMRNYDHQ